MGGSKECRRLSILRGDTHGMHARGSGGRAREKLFPFVLHSFNFHELGGGEKEVQRLVLSAAAFEYAYQRVEHEGAPSAVQYLQSVGLGVGF